MCNPTEQIKEMNLNYLYLTLTKREPDPGMEYSSSQDEEILDYYEIKIQEEK